MPESDVDNDLLKDEVQSFWQRSSCGEVYAQGGSLQVQLEAQAAERYRLEPYLAPFAGFGDGRGKDVLEVGVGMGADHLEWARSRPASLTGVDLTERAVALTKARLAMYGLASDLRVADAERLPFAAGAFDLVYSYGVLHHTPNTAQAVREVFRVLRPGGEARVMIYHRDSIVGAMLWARYALLHGKPRTSLTQIYSEHLESPGTKAYTVGAARELFSDFRLADIRVQLSLGDLLEGAVGQRHPGPLLRLAKLMWPRSLVRRYGKNFGLALLIRAIK